MKCPDCGRACWMKDALVDRSGGYRVRRTYHCRHCGWNRAAVMGCSYEIGRLTPDASAYLDAMPTRLMHWIFRRVASLPAFNNGE